MEILHYLVIHILSILIAYIRSNLDKLLTIQIVSIATIIFTFTLLGIIIGIALTIKLIKRITFFRDIWYVYYSIGLILFIITLFFIPEYIESLGILATFIIALLTFRTIDEMRASRVAEYRPRVLVDFNIPYGDSIIELVVKNEGRSLAKNVKFSITPELKDSKGRNLSEYKIFNEGIETLISGKEIRQVFDSGPSYMDEERNLPLLFDVNISYEDVEGNKYNDKMRLDLEVYKWAMYLPKYRGTR